MKYCPNCGAEITAEQKFCMYCGTKIEIDFDFNSETKDDIQANYKSKKEDTSDSNIGIIALVFTCIPALFYVGIILALITLATCNDKKNRDHAKTALLIVLILIVFILLITALVTMYYNR